MENLTLAEQLEQHAETRAIGKEITAAYKEGLAETAAERDRLKAINLELVEACEMQQRLIDDMMPYVGQMALPDYALLNEAPIKAHAALARAAESQARNPS